jgi:Dolichyl-phosphate-mannose-protein mannosyltransferase
MSPIAISISAGMVVSIGYALIRVVGPGERWPGGGWLRLLVAVPVGIGVCSALFLLSLVTGAPHFFLEAGVLVALSLVLFGRRSYSAPPAPAPAGRPAAAGGPFRALFWLLLAADGAVFGYRSLRWPRGGWDAWMIWNQRARFLYQAGGNWRDAFSPALAWSHTDYPLLVPGFLARAWTDLGGETPLAPLLLAAFFGAALVALLVLSLTAARGRMPALAAGILLLATPILVLNSAEQYVDVTLAFFILATLVLQHFADGSASPARFLALAGVTAGLAAWTKNEGLLLIVAVLLARTLALLLASQRRPAWRQAAAFLAGAAPFLLLIWYFRRTVVVSSYFLGQFGAPAIGHDLLDPHRYLLPAGAFLRQVWSFGSPLVSPAVFLIAYLLCTGVAMPRRHRIGFQTAALVLCIVAAGYFTIYVVTPHDPQWLLDTSLDRLCLQLWPGVLWVAGLAAGEAGGRWFRSGDDCGTPE